MATMRRQVVPSAARTTSGNSGTLQGFGDVNSIRVQLDIDAASGTSPTLNVTVKDSVDGGENWNVIDTFPQQTAAGVVVRTVTGITSDVLRVDWVIAGTTPSFTFDVDISSE